MGHDWEILEAEYKRHHGTGQNTVAIELLLAMRREHDLDASNVDAIDVVLTVERSHRKENLFGGPFESSGEAYSSMPFALAVALTHGEVTADHYTEAGISDAGINGVLQKIRVRFEDGHDVARYCRLEVTTADGRRLVRDSDAFMFPFPDDDWRDWLYKDGATVLTEGRLDRLLDQIVNLEQVDDVAEIMASVRKS